MTRVSPAFLLPALAAALLALAPSVAAQGTARPAAVAPSPNAEYAGLYATDGGMLEVRDNGSGLGLVAHGAPVAARLAALSASPAATDLRAGALLDRWVLGEVDAVAAAARPSRQAETAETLGAYRDALVRGYGDVVAGSVAGTFRQIDGREATLVQLLFEHGTDWAAFVWDEAGALVTVTRGLSPVVLGAVAPTGPDAFAHDVTFEREADGRVHGLRVGARFSAVR